MTERDVEQLASALRAYPGLERKAHIGAWARRFAAAARKRPGVYGPGDDAGAVALEDGGYLLLAAEGLKPSLLDDPAFAGFCSVTVNVNDIYAMGGRPVGMVSVVFEDDMAAGTREAFLKGMESGLEHYGLPMLGGHVCPEGGSPAIAVCIAGIARSLLRGDGARPGDVVLAATDLEGVAREEFGAWDTVTHAEGGRTLSMLEALVEAAERGLCTACRDISNPGTVGTLAMLLESSRAGATIDIDEVPIPEGIDIIWWLTAYPSFGFLLTVAPEKRNDLACLLEKRGVRYAAIGEVTEGSKVVLAWKGRSATCIDWSEHPITGI